MLNAVVLLLMRDNEFISKLMPDELAHWEACLLVAKNFLGDQRAEKYMPSLWTKC